MEKCMICGNRKASESLRVCVDCIRSGRENASFYAKEAHKRIRAEYGLPAEPPKSKGGISCNLCSNECVMKEGERSYCGLKENVNGKLRSLAPHDHALMHAYIDPLPTNCCAAWFCPGSSQFGKVNIAVFFYGCNFDCIFCQNASHKDLGAAKAVSIKDFVFQVLRKENAYCVCFFGGSPEPQLPFAIRASERILEDKKVRICWEWNGCGNRNLVKHAAEISFRSGGIVKFDLKAFNPDLSIALSGVPNKRAYENFELIAEEFFEGSHPPVLTATTLLVPFYVDELEVENIARFIASINPDIPYSLLVFHPDFYMRDMPITPREEVQRCYDTAKRHLKNVNIGNKQLLGL
ncbi:MAG: radical SAM protein [Methanophagales archaeon]|nr:radical SAM protein [Methanophagales archaeon]